MVGWHSGIYISIYCSTLAILAHVCWIIINFGKFISTNGIFLNILYYPSQFIFYLEEIIFENFNNSEDDIISVELAKALGYIYISHKKWIQSVVLRRVYGLTLFSFGFFGWGVFLLFLFPITPHFFIPYCVYSI